MWGIPAFLEQDGCAAHAPAARCAGTETSGREGRAAQRVIITKNETPFCTQMVDKFIEGEKLGMQS